MPMPMHRPMPVAHRGNATWYFNPTGALAGAEDGDGDGGGERGGGGGGFSPGLRVEPVRNASAGPSNATNSTAASGSGSGHRRSGNALLPELGQQLGPPVSVGRPSADGHACICNGLVDLFDVSFWKRMSIQWYF